MNPMRSLGPAIALWNFSQIWIYLSGPLLGALLAVVVEIILRGRGGLDFDTQLAVQGKIR